MTTLDDFFAKPIDSLHPRLRNWKERIAAGEAVKVEVYQSETDIGQGLVEMNLHFTEGGRSLPTETVLWNDDLNAGLIQMGVKAIDTNCEIVRFALGLRAAMRRPEREFGDGFFNAVLIELIEDSDLTQYEDISHLLKHIPTNRAHREGGAYDRYTICRELIAAAISGRAHELTELLKYSKEEAKRILVSSLARYLDERFSVSTRRQFGLL